MQRVKIIATVVVAVLLFIVVLQNTEAVETRLLFAQVTMPRALLLALTLLVGFGLGVVTCAAMTRKKKLPAAD